MSIRTMIVATVFSAGIVTPTLAQTRSSFTDVTSISGITVVQTGALSYNVSLLAGAAFDLGGTSYAISDLIGFWSLSDDINLGGSTSAIGSFDSNSSNSGTGGIVGWKARTANSGLTVGQSLVFTFDSLATADVDRWGFHVRLTSGNFPGTSGNTGNITGALIPVPGTLAGLAGFGFFAGRRRR